MFWYNTNIIKNAKKPAEIPTGDFLSERKPKNPDNIKLCSDCKRFFSGRNFWRHQKSCSGERPVAISPVVMFHEPHHDAEFVHNILDKFRDSIAGKLCMTNKVIKQVGYRHYCLRRCHSSKQDELRKSAMQEMRELARLLIKFRIKASEHGLDGSNMETEDMFTRPHLAVLRDAIDTLAGGGKYGLKLNLNAIIMRTIKSLKGMYAEAMQDVKCRELDMFTDDYKFRSHEVFATARYKAVAQSMDKARRPASLPEEQAVTTLKNYVTSEIARLTSAVEQIQGENYILLRSLVVCRLTLFNGRRGDEPSRMTLSEWQDAENGEWLRKHEVCTTK